MRATYSVWFNGLLHGRTRTKGDALDLLYRLVNDAQHHNFCAGIRGSEHSRAMAREMSQLMGQLASTIPAARKQVSRSRIVLDCVVGRQSGSVRRDTA